MLSWYEGINLETLRSMRIGSKWITDPDLIKKRQETAYSFVPYANIHSFVEDPNADTDADEEGEEENDDEEVDEEIEVETAAPSSDPSGSGPAA